MESGSSISIRFRRCVIILRMARGKSSKSLKIAVALVSGLAGVLFTWWWSEIYHQPLIKYYSQPYLKLHDEAIGHVYLWNDGRKTDRNIAVTLFTKIDPKDINLVDFTSDHHIRHVDNKTQIVLEELKPDEAADIVFSADGREDDTLMDIVSDTGKIVDAAEGKWWHFSWMGQLAFFLLSVCLGSLLFWGWIRLREVKKK